MKKNIKIVCDQASNIPQDIADKYDIEIISMTTRLDDKEYKHGEIENEEFIKKLRNSNSMPQTSQPTYVDFKEIFEKYVNENKSVSMMQIGSCVACHSGPSVLGLGCLDKSN